MTVGQHFANSTADAYYKSPWLPCMKDMAVSQALLYTRIYICNLKTETHVWRARFYPTMKFSVVSQIKIRIGIYIRWCKLEAETDKGCT